MTKETKTRYYQALRHMAQTMSSATTARGTLRSVIKATARAMEVAGSALLLLDPDREYLIPVAASGLSDWYLRKGLLNAQKSLPEVLEGKAVAILDAATDTRLEYPESAAKAGIASLLCVPVTHRGEIIAELRVYSRQQRQFSRRDREFLATVADLCATVLERWRLEQALPGGPTAPTGAQMPRSPSPIAPISFAHPSEEEFARLLDFYRIDWVYEPRSFPLHWEDDKGSEMFTPDFYLPELDLYVELTTLKPRLAAEKNRKVRRLKQLYPDINIRLLNKKDYHRLLAKYGHGPLGEAKVEGIERVLLSTSQIQGRVRQLARLISRDYEGRQPLLIGVLKGVFCFLADLMRHITVPMSVDFMAISYYGENSEAVQITKDLDTNISGRDVLMVEDIVDTGMTLNYILRYLRARDPASLRVCTLLDKRVRRLIEVPLDYVGFEIGDQFVVGYGLDYRGEYRNLPFIGVLNPELREA